MWSNTGILKFVKSTNSYFLFIFMITYSLDTKRVTSIRVGKFFDPYRCKVLIIKMFGEWGFKTRIGRTL